MDLFEKKCRIINDAVKHLITGEDIFSDPKNKQPMKVSKVINRAIQLKSLEVDTALLMLSKIINRQKGISTDRVVKLLMADDVGKHLIQIMDIYTWAYHGFMSVTDKDLDSLYDLKKYSLPAYDLYTGFYGNYEDSFVVKMKKHEGYDIENEHKNAIRVLCSQLLDLHYKLHNTCMTDKELKNGEELIRTAILTNNISLDVLVENLFKDKSRILLIYTRRI